MMISSLSLGLLSVLGVALAMPKTGPPSPSTYSHDAKGLQKQYDPLLKAYSKGNQEEIDKEFSIFLLPDEDKWFGEYFSAADIEKLKEDYHQKAHAHKQGFITITTKVMHSTSRFHAHCSPPDPNHPTKVEPRADAIQPTRDVPVEQFRVEFTSDDGKKMSNLENFVYIDGAFRFVGIGAYPFWAQPPNPTRTKDPSTPEDLNHGNAGA